MILRMTESLNHPHHYSMAPPLSSRHHDLVAQGHAMKPPNSYSSCHITHHPQRVTTSSRDPFKKEDEDDDAFVQRVVKEDNKNHSKIDDDGTASSLLSEPRGDSSVWDNNDDDDVQFQFEETGGGAYALERLQVKFARRDRILDRISQGKSRAFIELLSRHEQEVQDDERERILLRMLYETKKQQPPPSAVPWELPADVNLTTATTNGTKDISLEAEVKMESPTVSENDREIFLSAWKELKGNRSRSLAAAAIDLFTYEINTTVPAVFAFTLHCVVDYSIWDLVTSFGNYAYSRFDHLLWTDTTIWIDFIFGICLVRVSGGLYWWLSDRDYNCIKFDMHNRLRRGMWDARTLQWLYKHLFLRYMIFTIGYYLCFYALIHFRFRFAQLWNDRESLLKDLPSKKYDLNVCLADLHPFSCQAAVDLLEKQRQALRWADKDYTWKVLSPRSYDAYWIEAEEGLLKDGTPLVSQTQEVLLIVGTGLVALAGLRWYGLFFWLKS